VGVYTKSKTSELSPLRRKLLRFAKQFPPPLRSKKGVRNSKKISCAMGSKFLKILLFLNTKIQNAIREF
jgi:hypothetical protein